MLSPKSDTFREALLSHWGIKGGVVASYSWLFKLFNVGFYASTCRWTVFLRCFPITYPTKGSTAMANGLDKPFSMRTLNMEGSESFVDWTAIQL